MSKKHPIPNTKFHCWHCKHEFETKDIKVVETEGEVIEYAKCPQCGHTCTMSHTKPMKRNKFK